MCWSVGVKGSWKLSGFAIGFVQDDDTSGTVDENSVSSGFVGNFLILCGYPSHTIAIS
jgi:hypothetical protein